MRLGSTRIFPLVLMLALALLSFWLDRTTREAPGPVAPNRHNADYSAEHFTITDYGRDGSPESTLSAIRMVHYPEDDTTVLAAPRLVRTRAGQPRLVLSADRGTLSRDAEDIYLNDNVLLVREAAGEVPEARMRTSYLHLQRTRGVATTDREVQIEEPGRMLAGRGMDYDNVARRLTLLSEVRGQIEAKR
ncbi:MAG TPA: LPS export ABC transporter periplasmic protein LptC [Burkholderiales bacterium]|nr:LPS export ABC transporter periplasmic protein LptC [Burkholderiales bacterium]